MAAECCYDSTFRPHFLRSRKRSEWYLFVNQLSYRYFNLLKLSSPLSSSLRNKIHAIQLHILINVMMPVRLCFIYLHKRKEVTFPKIPPATTSNGVTEIRTKVSFHPYTNAKTKPANTMDMACTNIPILCPIPSNT